MTALTARRSTAHIVLKQLRAEIMSLDILPGAKLSEAEIAARFGVSRQPVREAFNLLAGQGLLLIQPQKATRVQRFSRAKIEASRFARLALEVEIARRATGSWSDVFAPGLERCLAAQDRAQADADASAFHRLDEEFHRLVAEVAGVPHAIEMALHHKSQIDRICVLSLERPQEMAELIADHRAIFEALQRRDAAGVESALRTHLSRIDRTIEAVAAAHPGYFSD